ncbi:MAG: hypothetical protein ACREDI_08255, partial [Roseiarcus sp.]
YIADSNGRVNVYYGTSQDDVERLSKIIKDDFDGEIDFVVDDASHFYELTKRDIQDSLPACQTRRVLLYRRLDMEFPTRFPR